MPDEEQLSQDYALFVEFYQRITQDPTTPEVLSLVSSVIDIDSIPTTASVSPFKLRPPKKKGISTGGRDRYSKESKIIGDRGEDIVMKSEARKLKDLGKSHLIEKIVHEEAEGNRPGWDISSFDENEEQICIEVKATAAKSIDSVELTENEWNAAQNPKYRDRYYIYLVTDTMSSEPKIERLCSPQSFVESGELPINPIRFRLSLTKSN